MHNFKKKYGQNFIFDQQLLSKIVEDANIDSESIVVEVGAGMGTLTSLLAQKAKQVYSFEIDLELKPYLEQLEKKHKNLKVFFEDFMLFDLKQLHLDKFVVVANLPYYITTAIITKLLKENPQRMCLMVQKEVAERLASVPHNKEYGAITAILNHQARVEIARVVGREMFNPIPNVDSAVITLEFNGEVFDEGFETFVYNCFTLKRKTLLNNFKNFINDVNVIKQLMEKMGIKATTRPEELSSEELYQIYKEYLNILKK